MSSIRVRRGYRNPYSQVPEFLLDAEACGVSDRGCRLWGLLDRYAGQDGQAYPSRKTLARRLRCSLDSLDRSVRELEATGWLEVERREASTSLYTLMNPAAEEAGGSRTGAAPPSRVVAAPGSRTGAAPPSRVVAAPGSRTGAAQKDSQGKESPPSPPGGGPEWPEKVDRRKVSDAERELTDAVLVEFNAQAGTAYSGAADHRRAIVGRLREHPRFDLAAHGRLIRAALADPWWKGPPGPQVIYGNAGVFEQAIERAKAYRGATVTDVSRERHREAKHAEIVSEVESSIEAARSPEAAEARREVRDRILGRRAAS